MRTVEQLRKDFELYTAEIQKCEDSKCYWALLHMLLVLPDICATLEAVSGCSDREVGDRYVRWCTAHMPATATMSGDDRWQMRNALLHSGSSTAQNLGKKHKTNYVHFSFVDPDSFDFLVHGTADSGLVLNVHVTALAAETKKALESWFQALDDDSSKMDCVEKNIGLLSRRQPKEIDVIRPSDSQATGTGWTNSSS